MDNSDINPKPGMLQQSLEVLKRKCAEKEANNEKLTGGLLWDEMSIRSALRWTDNAMHGFENLPNISIKDRINARIATEVIVFMFTAINDDVKLPVAYYFTATTYSNSRNQLAQEIIKAVIECGVVLKSITFDGHKSNPGACTLMGANLNIFFNEFDPSFCIENAKINILLYPSHMIKMMRGAIGNKKILYDANDRAIKWVFLERLVNFKEQ